MFLAALVICFTYVVHNTIQIKIKSPHSSQFNTVHCKAVCGNFDFFENHDLHSILDLL